MKGTTPLQRKFSGSMNSILDLAAAKNLTISPYIAFYIEQIKKTKTERNKMNFTPVNNYLSVRTVEDTDTEDSGILLPQDYRAVESPFAVVEVINCSGENGTLWGAGLQLVVEAHMLRDIEHNGETFTVIKENHVIGILSEE